jgi:predicted DNA-binding transcriptional regulator AlpA
MNAVREYEFLFVVDGVSLDDDDAVGTITDVFDGIASDSRGIFRIAVSGEGTDAVTAAGDLASRMMSLVPGLRVLRLDPDLVGVPDIAQRARRTRQNVQQWVNGTRNSERQFPPPEGCAGQSLVWHWAEVNDWLAPLGLADGETRPSRAEAARIDVLLLDKAEAAHQTMQLAAS